MKISTFGLTLKSFCNAYKGKPYFRGGLENRSKKSASKQALLVPIKILRFAFTGLVVMLQNVITGDRAMKLKICTPGPTGLWTWYAPASKLRKIINGT